MLRPVANDHIEIAWLPVVATDTKWNDWGQRSPERLLAINERDRQATSGWAVTEHPLRSKCGASGSQVILLKSLR